MAVAYINPGEPLTATRWNTLAGELDQKLRFAFNNQSIALWGQQQFLDSTDPQRPFLCARRFYFGSSFDNPATGTPNTISAQFYQTEIDNLNASGAGIAGTSVYGVWPHLYNHSDFTSYAAACTLATTIDPRPIKDDDFPLYRVTKPGDASTRASTIWADVIARGLSAASDDRILDYSLECHQVTESGRKYYMVVDVAVEPYIIQQTCPELWTPIEVFLLKGCPSPFNWSDLWNRYRFLRIHNLTANTVTVNLPGEVSFELEAMQCRCVRLKHDGTWSIGLHYFWTMELAEDPWMLGDQWLSEFYWLFGCNITDCLIGAQILGSTQYQPYVNATQFKDISSIYWPTYYPPIANGTALGDILFHRGSVLIVDPDNTETRQEVTLSHFGALGTDLGAYGFTVTEDGSKNTIISRASGSRDIVGLSTDLLYRAIGCAAANVDSSGPVNMTINGFYPATPACTIITNTVNSSVAWNDGTNEYLVSWDNHTHECNLLLSQKFSISDTYLDWWQYCQLGTGQSTANISIGLSALGPIATIEQTGALKYPLSSSGYPDKVYTFWEIRYVAGPPSYWQLYRKREAPLFDYGNYMPDTPGISGDWQWELGKGNGHGKWPLWGHRAYTCWPRRERAWQNIRQRHIDNTQDIFTVGGDNPPKDWPLRPVLKETWEVKPYAALTNPKALLVPQTSGIKKTGIKFLGEFTRGISNILTPLSAWQNYEVLTFKSLTGTVTQDYTAGSVERNTLYSSLRSDLLAGMLQTGTSTGPEMMAIEAETFNALASMCNGLIGTRNPTIASHAHNMLFTIGSGTVGDLVGYGIGPSHLRPKAQWIGWSAGSNPDLEAMLGDYGIAVRTGADLPGSMATLLATQSKMVNNTGAIYAEEDFSHNPIPILDHWGPAFLGGDKATVQGYVDNYRWVSITDGIALCNALAVPFIMQELCVPVDLVTVDGTLTNFGGISPHNWNPSYANACGFRDNASGDWVIDCNAKGSSGNPIIRATQTSTDYAMINPGDGNIYGVDFGTLTPYLWGAVSALPQPPQYIAAHTVYLARRYGATPGSAVIFGRNYADYTRLTKQGMEYYTPRNAKTTLESGDPDVISLGFPGAEATITTAVEHGELVIWDAPYTFPT